MRNSYPRATLPQIKNVIVRYDLSMWTLSYANCADIAKEQGLRILRNHAAVLLVILKAQSGPV